MISSAFTIIAPIDPARRDELAGLLSRIDVDPAANDVWSAADVEGVHYACGAILPRAQGGAQFMLELNGDGTEGQIVDRAVAATGVGLTRLFSCCVGAPDDAERLQAYLHDHVVRAGASHVGNVGRTRDQIFEEADAAASVLAAIDEARRDDRLPDSPSGVADLARSVWSPSRPPQRRTLAERTRFIVRLAAVVICIGVPAIVLFPVTIVAALWLRAKERTDPVHTERADPGRLRELAQDDDQLGSVSNHLISVVPIKPGRFRLMLLRLVLLVLDALARVAFDKGKLGSLDSIHFAHWSIIDEGRTLLFVSNFDGSWESYLDDFIEKAHSGLTAVWSNSLGFPRTSWLVRDGATDGPLFKNFARCSQQEEGFWYRAYPALTVRSIDETSALRNALATRSRLPDWLAPTGERSEGTTPPPDVSEVGWDTGAVQSLVLSGHGKLPAARFVTARLPGSPDAARAWLAELLPQVSVGDVRGHEGARQLAFTASGFRRLGVPERVLDGFGAEFVDGLGTPHRSRILGDLGASAPERWSWGGPDDEIDVLALLYATDDAAAHAMAHEFVRSLVAAGGSATGDPKAIRLPEDGKEHFGFADGISQPVLAGTDRPGDKWSTVAPGEVVLGLRDGGEGPIPPAPGGPGWEDLGHLGSFLVVRQLSQDVAGFWSAVRGATADDESAEVLAARMVGRRRDGTSLVADIPGGGFAGGDNDFGYAHADPEGLACPVGSHVRRANPRDTGAGKPGRALTNNNRHRLLRRGRLYGPPLASDAPDDGEDRGLFFLCLVADLARQFEFVQHHWLNGPNFASLGEVDPLSGSQVAGNGRFTWGDLPVVDRVSGLPDFVQTRGGVYAFLPALPALRRLAGVAP